MDIRSRRVPLVFDAGAPAIGARYTPLALDTTRRAASTHKVPMFASRWAEHFISITDGNTGKTSPFSFAERRYLKRPYDTKARRLLLFTSRQTEKCQVVTEPVSLFDGRQVPAGEIRVGDVVATLRADGTIGSSRVVRVFPRRKKECVRIETRQGHILSVALTHPMRTWESWTEAGDLALGTRLAAVRRCGVFTGLASPPEERIRLTAYLIGDGSIGGKVIGFTAVPGPVLDEFCSDVRALGGTWREYKKPKGKALDVRLRELPVLKEWLREDALLGCHSDTKQIPDWVFGLSRTQTALFLNRLWSTDGHVSQRTPSMYNITYASISRRLVEQVQALLWKFGIPSAIRKMWPNYHKKRGTEKFAYLLDVETKNGVSSFLRDIGALGKSEAVPLPTRESNNNLDTIPRDVQGMLYGIVGTHGRRSGLFQAGLARTIPYAPTREKMARYVETLRADARVDQSLVDALQVATHEDVYWDRVKDLELIGEQECVDFEVEDTHNFVASGLITHNSTTLGNKLLTQSGMRERYNSLFVSPSALQTTVFSRTRIDDIVESSPRLKVLIDKSKTMNILEKQWINNSKIYLRYAFLSADRIRGLSVNSIFLDEVQDLVKDLIPVIEESASRFQDALYVYSGTPKSYANTIEHYWSRHSTMTEWAIPCEHHGGNNPASWYWNVLGLKNIGKNGPICDRCGNALNPEHPAATWVSMAPGREYEGYRICRLMVPWFYKDPAKWADLLRSRERYSTERFMNEVMALSHDGGMKPISTQEMARACDNDYDMDEDKAAELGQRFPLYLGLDWGMGTDNAHTVATIGGYTRGDRGFQIIYAKRFTGHLIDPDERDKEIHRLIAKFRIKLVGADFGIGFDPVNRLIKRYGPGRVHVFHYAGRIQKKFDYKKPLHRTMVFRSPVMADMFAAIKAKKVRFPSWEKFQTPFGDDFLSIIAEESRAQNMLIYNKTHGNTDDTFHSSLYCLLASCLEVARPDIFSPIQEDDDRAHAEAMAAAELFAAHEVNIDDNGFYS